MSAVTSELVKKLREQTGARMLDCQKALQASQWDLEAAMVWLRKKNLATGGAASGRAAAEGRLGSKLAPDGGALVLVELSANTDFVIQNREYLDLLEKLTGLALEESVDSAEALNALSLQGRSVRESVQELAGKIGENVAVKRVVRVTGSFGYYIHHDHKQAAVVELEGVDAPTAAEVGKELAMHLVAAKPQPVCVRREEVAAETIDKEREIIKERLRSDPKNEKKPPEILAKIAEGQLGKFYAEQCFLEQPFFREESQTVARWLAAAGRGAKIRRFTCLRVGQG